MVTAKQKRLGSANVVIRLLTVDDEQQVWVVLLNLARTLTALRQVAGAPPAADVDKAVDHTAKNVRLHAAD